MRDKKMYLIEPAVNCTFCGKNWDIFVDRSGVEYISENGKQEELKISDSTCPNCHTDLFEGFGDEQ